VVAVALRERWSSAHVVAVLALVVAVGSGGAAYALGKNTVGSPQIIDRSIKATDLKGGDRAAVTSGKIRNGTVRFPDLASGSVGSAQIKDDAILPRHLAPGAVPDPLSPLPSGETMYGVYAVSAQAPTPQELPTSVRTAVQWPRPLGVDEVEAYLTGYDGETAPPPGCTGSAANPTAAPGVACFYVAFQQEVNFPSSKIYDPALEPLVKHKAGRYGALLHIQRLALDDLTQYFYNLQGVYAVTAP
jgi:hypothetical protein